MGSGTSVRNVKEAEFVVALVRRLYGSIPPTSVDKPSVAVVTPYRDQVHEVRRELGKCDALPSPSAVKVGTVDGFQGQEADVVIISCVRSSGENHGRHVSTGFVADVRRMNVAITRAKRSLWIVGNASVLESSVGGHWRDLIEGARLSNRFFSSDLPVDQIAGPWG